MKSFSDEELARVRDEFHERGESVAGWARRYGFSANTVYQVLHGRSRALHGDGHRVAVALGLKAQPKTNTKNSPTQENAM